MSTGNNQLYPINVLIWQACMLYGASLANTMPFVLLLTISSLLAQSQPLAGIIAVNMCNFFIELILACLINQTANTERLPYDYILNHVFRRFPSALFALFLLTTAMLCGVVLLALPSILAFVYLRFYYCYILFEESTAIVALKRSYQLVKNNGWHTFTALVTITLVLFCIKMLSTTLINHLSPTPSLIQTDSLLEIIEHNQAVMASQSLAARLASALTDALITPFIVTTTILLYRDLTKKKNHSNRETAVLA